MVRVPVKDGENIERALKVYKRKFMRSQTKNKLQENKHFTKPSVAKRTQVIKAHYIQQLRDEANV